MDPYLRLVSRKDDLPGRLARGTARRLGLPAPVRLERYAPASPGDPDSPDSPDSPDAPGTFAGGPLVCGGTGGRLLDPALRSLTADAADESDVHVADVHAGGAPGGGASGGGASGGGGGHPPRALLFDASGITDSVRLREAYDFLHPRLRRIATCGRLVVLGSLPEQTADVAEATAQAALDGLVRSAGKEVGRGTTANLIRVAPGGEDALAGPLAFLLSPRSAYVSGQTLTVGAPFLPRPPGADQRHLAGGPRALPLEGRTAVVTGAARGIGAEIARVLARDGARVVCLDRPDAGDALAQVAGEVGGSTLQLDITAAHAPGTLAEHLLARHDGADVLVHNAGVLADRTLRRMSAEEWDRVLRVNLTAQERLDAELFARDALRPGGRLVSVASVSGIAGNRGQANYATSKAGVIGRVRALAARTDRVTVNAVAPGFVETAMTRSMPLAPREAGRRLSSLGQGGLPVDVAEAVAFLASPGAYAVHGTVLRVCGQSLLGA